MPRPGVQYVGNEEPAFIKQFKQKIGYKDSPDINSKRNIPNFDKDEEDEDEDILEQADEKPVVVVVKSGDLTAEEAEVEQKQIEDGPARLDEKITFKKPVKRSKDSENSTETEDVKTKQKKHSDKGKKSQTKKTKNTSLLSFGDEEDEGS